MLLFLGSGGACTLLRAIFWLLHLAVTLSGVLERNTKDESGMSNGVLITKQLHIEKDVTC